MEYSASALAALYVAVTRARVTLHVVYSDADRRRLQTLVNRAEMKA